MVEPRPKPEETSGWTTDQLKQLVESKIADVQRAVDVALEGEPPHVTLQYHIEALLGEREKQIQLALTSANELEQERIARARDQIDANQREAELTRQLSDTAILKAETSSDKRFDEFKEAITTQMALQLTAIEGLTRRMDTMLS
jgi:hypothetical protein